MLPFIYIDLYANYSFFMTKNLLWEILQKVNEIPEGKEVDFINRRKMSGNLKISLPICYFSCYEGWRCLDKANKITGARTMDGEGFLTLNVVIVKSL